MVTRTVDLSDGTKVIVGKLTWKAAKRVKQLVIDVLSKDAESLIGMFDQVKNGDEAAIKVIGQKLLTVLEELGSEIDLGCIQNSAEVLTEDMPYEDRLEISAAVAELNDLQKLLDLEKKSPAAKLVTTLFSKLRPAVQNSEPDTGITSSNLDAFDPASPQAN